MNRGRAGLELENEGLRDVVSEKPSVISGKELGSPCVTSQETGLWFGKSIGGSTNNTRARTEP